MYTMQTPASAPSDGAAIQNPRYEECDVRVEGGIPVRLESRLGKHGKRSVESDGDLAPAADEIRQ